MSLKSCADAYAKSLKAGGSPARPGNSSNSRTPQKRSTGNVKASSSSNGVSSANEARFRLLPSDELGSVIFGCSNATMNECLSKNLFGLPGRHMVYVQNIRKGMPLFLFKCTDRKLHGIYEAISDGKRNIDTTAWPSHSTGQTMYPAQVSACIRQQCNPLLENAFKNVIKDNYYAASPGQNNHIMFELDHQQTYKLIMLFLGLPPPSPTGKFPILKPVKALCSSRPSVIPRQIENLQIGSQVQSPDDGLQSKDDIGGRLSSLDESEQEVESCALNDIDNTEATNSFAEDLCVSYSEILSPSVSASSKPSSNSLPEENALEFDKKEITSVLVPKPNGSPEEERLHKRIDLQECAEISNGGLNCVAEEANLKFPEKEVECFTPVSNKQNEENQSHVELSPQEDKSQRVKPNDFNQGSDVPTFVVEQTPYERKTEQPGHVLSSEDTATCVSHQSKTQLFSAFLLQLRQEGLELRQLVKEAWIEQHRELQTANALLEYLKVKMSSEVSSLRAEVAELRDQVMHFYSQKEKENMGKAFQTNYVPSVPIYKSGSDVHILGGFNGDLWLGTVDVFSPPLNELKTAVPMPTTRPCPAASAFNSCIYVFGGGYGSSWFDVVETYDLRKGQWHLCSPMNLKRGSLAGATVSQGIIALGGENEQGPVSDVELYDAYIGNWTESAKMLEKRTCLAAVEIDGAVYSLGGFNGSQYLRTVERLDPRQGSWTSVASMISPRGGLSAALLNGKIYALGGFDGHSFLNTVEVFDPRADKWEKVDPMGSQRAHGAAAVVDNTLYLIGGLYDGNGYIGSMECYQVAVGWQALGPAPIGKRCYVSAVVL
eukprot:Gb_10275 [translate_table: standard]